MKTNGISNNRFFFVLFLTCLFILAICFVYIFAPRIMKNTILSSSKAERKNICSFGTDKVEIERAEQVLKIEQANAIRKAQARILKKWAEYSNLYSEMIDAPAPDFSLKDFIIHNFISTTFDSSIDNLRSLRGKVVVINFWATWRGSCVSAIPHLNELVDKFKEQPVCFVSITDEERSVVMPFLRKTLLKTCVGFDKARSIFTDYGVERIPHTVLVDKKGIVVAITYPQLVSEQVINNILLGEKPDIRAFPVVKYGDAASMLKMIELDEKYLPFKTIKKNDVKRVLLFSANGSILTKGMQKDFESHVFHQLRWIIEGNFESYIWLKKRENPDYKGEFSREAAKFEYDAIFIKPRGTTVTKVLSGNTTFVSIIIQEPPHVIQFGFVDVWLKSIQADRTGTNHIRTFDTISPSWQELRERLGKEGIVAKVSIITKNSAGDYHLLVIILYYDSELSMFRTFEFIALTIRDPLEDIPSMDILNCIDLDQIIKVWVHPHTLRPA
ncbi:MAG TPA: TlpA disulfide reductase family protein [Sedimentisphaerales bacterium]|nr:TlpA disulfide reductase family protein [Sedimentisphaerales bacterium]